jgi:cell division septation protein DedD
MDPKKTQRIIGILVVIALVIIIFPLLFGKNETPSQMTMQKAPPPLSEEVPSTTLAQNNETSSLPTQDETLQPVANTEEKGTDITPAIAQDVNASTEMEAKSIKTIEAPSMNNGQQAVVVVPSSKDTAATSSDNADKVKSISAEMNQQEVTPSTEEEVKPVVHPSLKTVHAKKEPQKINGHWAVQLGSFNQKTNAHHLADKLREAGFKVFVREIKSAKGKVSTRVYVGPEAQHASAAKLSEKIEQKMNLHGIVVTYRPA